MVQHRTTTCQCGKCKTWRSNLQAPTTSTETFTIFKIFPQEIQDKIWDEALNDPRVLYLKASHNGTGINPCSTYTVRNYWGFDPSQVALACQDAAARWRALYPVTRIDGRGGRSWTTRLMMENTIFMVYCSDIFLQFMNAAAHADDFKPCHVAIKQAPATDVMRRCPAIPQNTFGLESLFEVRAHQGRSHDRIVADLIEMVANQQPGNRRFADQNGIEWIRELPSV